MSTIEEKLQREKARLSEEAEALVLEREQLANRMKEIDTRLTQVAGAMVTLYNIFSEEGDKIE